MIIPHFIPLQMIINMTTMHASQSRFTVAKLDAGMAILLTSDHHLIEFPSLLLPAGIHAGSIIDLNVAQNAEKEAEEKKAFDSLQNEIRSLFGEHPPSTPELSVRNITQTSIVLEWKLLDLATADMRSIALYKNGSKLGRIPNATTTTTKLSGLALDTEYTFQLILKTTAGIFKSQNLKVKTHKMTNLSGLNVCVANLSAEKLASVTAILERIGAKPPHDKVRIDTTHFVTSSGTGEEFRKAQSMNIPIVVPDFLEGCEAEGRLMRAGQYYLDSDPSLRPQRTMLSRTTSTTAASEARPETASSTTTAVGADVKDAVKDQPAEEPETIKKSPTPPPPQAPPSEPGPLDNEESGPPQRARGTDPASSQSQKEKAPVDPNKGISKKGSTEFKKLASYLKSGEDEEMPTPSEEKGKGKVKPRGKSITAEIEQEQPPPTPSKDKAVPVPDTPVENMPKAAEASTDLPTQVTEAEKAEGEKAIDEQVSKQENVEEATEVPLPEEKFESVAL